MDLITWKNNKMDFLNADSLNKRKLIKYRKYITNLTSLTIIQYFFNILIYLITFSKKSY
jgi:hypothetical protein